MSPDDFKTWLAGVLPNTKAAMRTRAWKFLVALMKHGKHGPAVKESKVSWGSVHYLICRHEAFKVEYEAVCAMVEFRRRIQRFEEADQRAVEGWLEPVFGAGPSSKGTSKGTIEVGTIRRFSDKLMLAMLAACDPDRFGKKAGEAPTVGPQPAAIHYHVHLDRSLPEANKPRPPKVIDSTDEDATKKE